MISTSDPRVDALERRVRELEATVAVLTGSRAEPPPPPPPPPRPETRIAPPAATTPSVRTLTVRRESALKWGGVTLVVLAVGFAVSTAISRGWIGAELQLAGAVALSATLVAVGLRLRATRLPWTHALCSGGIAAFATTFASHLFIDQTSAGIAFTAIVVVGFGGALLARQVPSEWVGVTTLLGTVVGWLVIGDGEPPFPASLGGVALATAVAVAISLDRGWFALRALGHVVGLGCLIGLAAASSGAGEQTAVFVAAALPAISLCTVPSIGDRSTLWQRAEIQTAAAVPPWTLLIIASNLGIDGSVPVGLTALGTAVVALLVSIALRPRLADAHVVSIVLGASVCTTIGAATLLAAEPGFVALATQGAGLVVLSRILGRDIRIAINAGVLLYVSTLFVLLGGIAAWTDDVSIGADIARLGTLFAIGIALRLTGHRPTQRYGGATFLALLLVWLGSVLVHLPEGQAAVSISWALVGTVLVVWGTMGKVPDLGTAGLTVLTLTVGKLLVVDMNEVDPLWRAGLFFAVGLALMRLGFLLPRLTRAAAGRDGFGEGADPTDRPSG